MKKIVSIALVALMLVALALPVFADALPNNATDDSLTSDVTVTVNKKTDGGNTGVTYKVDIAWVDLAFTLTNAVWDPENFVYTGEWVDNTGRNVTVTNSSNADVYVRATVENAQVDTGVQVILENSSFKLASATTNNAATSDAFTVKVDGAPKSDATVTVGTVTVALSTTPFDSGN